MPALEKPFNLTVNGSAMELDGNKTVSDLLKHLKIEQTLVAVELNREIIRKQNYDQTFLRAGDVVEIVHFVGGG